MRRSGSCLALAAASAGLAAASAALPAAVGAQTGNGLYEPFPRAESKERAERFVERLPRAPNEVRGRPGREELERGRFVAGGNEGTTRAPGGPASARAGRDSRAGSSLGWPVELALALIVLAATPLAIAAARRRDAARRRLLATAALAGAAVLGASIAVAADGGGDRAATSAPRFLPTRGDFFGVVAPDVLAGDGGYRRRTLTEQHAGGIELIRQTVDWADIEKRPGRYDFSRYDRYVADLAERRMRLLPILFHPPSFRSPGRGRPGAGFDPPRRARDMAAFAAAAARRYGPGGSFWRRRPRLPELPVRSWQVWNEPNLDYYWGGAADATAYTRLLQATGRAIKRVDPRAEIVTAGIAQSLLGIPAREFVEAIYRAGGERAFDTLALNAYARDPDGLVQAVASTRELLERHGDRAPIWLTEFGWATGGPLSDFTVGERRQARHVGRSLRELTVRRRELGLRGVVYFRWRDAPPYSGERDFFGLHTGLLRVDGRPKPALAAFRRAATLRP